MLEAFFIFDGKFYKQCDDVVMGFPLGIKLANVFMCHFKTSGWKTVLLISLLIKGPCWTI